MRKNFQTDTLSLFSHNSEENASPHRERCSQLLQSKHLKGWERLFINALLNSKAICRKDQQKLAAIENKIVGLGGETDA